MQIDWQTPLVGPHKKIIDLTTKEDKPEENEHSINKLIKEKRHWHESKRDYLIRPGEYLRLITNVNKLNLEDHYILRVETKTVEKNTVSDDLMNKILNS